jgi:IS605 OrfB family transposase
LDETLYRVFETETAQGIAISCLERGERLHLPLKGKGEIKGNLRVVLVSETRSVELHIPFEIKESKPASAEVVVLDVGITEVFADDAGNLYGQEMGAVLKKASAELADKGKKRNKLHGLRKTYRQQGKGAKARRIGQYNLGRKKQRARKRRIRARIAGEINRAFNQVIEKREPAVIVTEKLDLRGPAQSKEISRRVSYWHRQTLKERIEFKASAAGCRREQINPAYTSQTCPNCGYLNKANRKGDRFQCLHCGHAGHADVIAAINQKARMNDREITLYTPKETVRLILVRRYESRLEHRNASVREDQDGDRSGADSRTRISA